MKKSVIILLFISTQIFTANSNSKALELFNKSVNAVNESHRLRLRKKLIKLYPDSAYGIFCKAWLEQRKKNFSKAIVLYNKAIDKKSKFAEAYTNIGNCYFNQKKYYLAEKHFTKSLNINPRDHIALSNRAYVYLQIKKYKSSIADYTKAIKLNPNVRSYYISRAVVYRLISNFKEAIKDYTKAIEFHDYYGYTHFFRGKCYTQLKKYRKALSDFNVAIRKNAEESFFYDSRAKTHLKLDNLKKALADFNIYVKLSKANEIENEIYILKAHIHSKLNDFKNALSYYKKAFDSEKDNYSLIFRIAWSNFKMHNYQDAIKYLTLYIAKKPYDPRAYKLRSKCYFILEKEDLANADLKKSKELLKK